MSDDDGFDPSRQVPKGLDKTDKIWGYTKSEVVTVVMSFFVGMMLSGFLPTSLNSIGPFLLFGGGIAGILLVYLTPNHLEPTEWFGSMGHYISRPKTVPHLSLADGMARKQKDAITETEVYELNERTQDVTWVQKIHKDAQAIERIDGGVVGGIKVEPANMALTSDAKWEKMIDDWQSYLDHTLEYPVQIYATSVTFPVEDYVEHYKDRLDSPDLQERPIMQELLSDFLEWYPEYLRYQGTHQKDYYLIFTVEEDEVFGSELQEQGVVEQLSELPVVGEKINALFGSQRDKTRAEVRAKQFAELNTRCREGMNQGVRPLMKCNARRLSAFELSVLLKEYWEGREIDLKDERALNTHGVSYRADEAPVSPDEYPFDGGTDMI